MKKYFIITSLLLSLLSAELIKPESSQTLNYRHVLFEWSQLPDAIEYNLQVSEQSNFNNLLLDINEASTIHIDEENFNFVGSHDCTACDNIVNIIVAIAPVAFVKKLPADLENMKLS